MKQPNRTSIGSTGRTSRSLGASDPRAHRNPQAVQSSELLFEHPLVVQNRRLKLVPAKRVSDSDASTIDEVNTKINQILEALKSAGLME